MRPLGSASAVACQATGGARPSGQHVALVALHPVLAAGDQPLERLPGRRAVLLRHHLVEPVRADQLAEDLAALAVEQPDRAVGVEDHQQRAGDVEVGLRAVALDAQHGLDQRASTRTSAQQPARRRPRETVSSQRIAVPSRRRSPTTALPGRSTSPAARPSTSRAPRPSASSALQPVSSSNAGLTYRSDASGSRASARQTATPRASSILAPAGARRAWLVARGIAWPTAPETHRRAKAKCSGRG